MGTLGSTKHVFVSGETFKTFERLLVSTKFFFDVSDRVLFVEP